VREPQFEIATFLLERGANQYGLEHTRAGRILHECAIRGNYEAAQFAIDHGIDMTCAIFIAGMRPPEGWAAPAVQDRKRRSFLAGAERGKERAVPLDSNKAKSIGRGILRE